VSIEIIAQLAATGAAASFAASAIAYALKNKNKKSETLDNRIEKLTNALQQSSHLISEVEAEIQSPSQLVAELKKDAEKYEKLVSINQEQVEAVAQLLNGELRKEGRRSFWGGFILNLVFFLLGSATSVFAPKWF